MSKSFFASLLIIILSGISFSMAAQKDLSKTNFLAKYQAFEPEAKMSSKQFLKSHSEEMGLSFNSELRLESNRLGYNNYRHERHKQFHRGLEVVGSSYILHLENDLVVYANGSYLPKIEIVGIPQLQPKQIIEVALEDMGDLNYSYDYINMPDKSEARLVIIDSYFPSHSNEYALAYELKLESSEPLNKRVYYVDALNGKVINHFSLIRHQDVEATALTKYYGEKIIIVDSIGPQEYILRDNTRGDGITTTTKNPDGTISNNSTYWDLAMGDNEEVALDVHWCTEMFYDLLLENFSWNGLDNNGKSLNPIVHAYNGNRVVNAHWDGDHANFGNGDCHRGPLTTLEVVGHEFMHGVTEFSSGLVYSSESGAINESLSDIMGKALEFQEDPAGFDWYIGESFLYNDKVEPFRSMADPKLFNDPDYYKGLMWEDRSGVHTNSGVGNKWFHFLVEGGNGITETGENFNINGIGMLEASKIAFLTGTNYLNPGSDYNDFYRQSLKACEEIFGPSAAELDAVIEAWKAVGLPSGTFIQDLDLSVITPEDEFIYSTCINNDYYPIVQRIHNNSTTDYLPSYGAQLIINYKSDDYFYPIDSPIAAGDSIDIIINDLMFFDQTRDYFATITLDFRDFNANNNREFVYVSNSINEEPDLEINGLAVDINCSAVIQSISVSLENLGCSLPANEEIIILVKDSDDMIVWEKVLLLESEFQQNNTRIYFANFPIQAHVLDYKLSVSTQLDSDLSNNETVLSVRSTTPISENYLNEFSDENELFSTIKLNSTLARFDTPIFNYQGESYFATAGYSDKLIFPACEGGAEVLFDESTSVQGLNAEMEICLDLQDLINPRLKFDMIHFQNQDSEEYVEFMDLSTMVKISWEGTDQGQEIITGQEEGLLVSHELSLPEHFVGTLSLDYFTLSGVRTNNPNFLDYDVILIDNLEVSSQSVAVKETENLISIYPNPADHWIQVKGLEAGATIQIYDLTGQQIPAHYEGNKIDISNLNDGVFLLHLLHENSKVGSYKITVIK